MNARSRILFLAIIYTAINPVFAGADEASKPTTNISETLSYALYTFSTPGRGGMHHGYNAGAYVTLEVTPHKKDANKVDFRITNLIPEPWSRIGSIGLDLGHYTNLFSRLELDKFIGQHYRLTYFARPYTHAFWPDFNAYYYLSSTLDPRLAKQKDPRNLSPGSSLTLTATLNHGIRYEDVIAALNHGLKSRDGLRVAIIGLHLAGQPLPGGTRMDDGGYFTGRLVRTSRPHVTSTARSEAALNSIHSGKQESASESTTTGVGAADDIPMSNTQTKVAAPAKRPELTQSSSVAENQATPTSMPPEAMLPLSSTRSRNPWCRFCPDPSDR